MSATFTVELRIPGLADSAKVELFKRDGEWWITSKGQMECVYAPDCTWKNTPRTYADLIDAYSSLWSELDDLAELGFVRVSEVWGHV